MNLFNKVIIVSKDDNVHKFGKSESNSNNVQKYMCVNRDRSEKNKVNNLEFVIGYDVLYHYILLHHNHIFDHNNYQPQFHHNIAQYFTNSCIIKIIFLHSHS